MLRCLAVNELFLLRRSLDLQIAKVTLIVLYRLDDGPVVAAIGLVKRGTFFQSRLEVDRFVKFVCGRPVHFGLPVLDRGLLGGKD